jgi:hypothetical protein
MLRHSFLRKEIVTDLFNEVQLQFQGKELPAYLRREELFESMYAELLFSFFSDDIFSLNLETVFGIMAHSAGYEFSVTPALNMFYTLHFPFTSRFGTEFKWYSGNFNDKSEMPVITRKKAGYSYDAQQTNLFAFKAQYLASLTKTFSFETSFAIFARTSTEIIPSYWCYADFENKDSDKYLLGSEYVFMLLCSPFSDLSFNIGAVLFFPDAGIANNVYNEAAPVKWDIILGAKISL